MIIIQGKDRYELLKSFDHQRRVVNDELIEHNYTHEFSCKPAEEKGDALLLKTYNDRTTITMLRTKAERNEFHVELELEKA